MKVDKMDTSNCPPDVQDALDEAYKAGGRAAIGRAQLKIAWALRDMKLHAAGATSDLQPVHWHNGYSLATTVVSEALSAIGSISCDTAPPEVPARATYPRVAGVDVVEVAIGITTTPDVQDGQACIDGTRWPTSTSRSFNLDRDRIMSAYPDLTASQVQSAIDYEKTRYTDPKPFRILDVDPHVRVLVTHLRASGFKTSDSGDGRTKPAPERALHIPHVFIPCATVVEGEAVAMALLQSMKNAGVDFTQVDGPEAKYAPRIDLTWSPHDGVAMVGLYNVLDVDLNL